MPDVIRIFEEGSPDASVPDLLEEVRSYPLLWDRSPAFTFYSRFRMLVLTVDRELDETELAALDELLANHQGVPVDG